MKIKDLFKESVQRLKQAGLDEAELDVSLLLARLLNTDRTSLLLTGDRFLAEAQLAEFENYMVRRLQREPLAYIIGEKEFWSLSFKVSKDVLIPRPETELLVEAALKNIRGLSGIPDGRKLKILDLGTGSGIISVVMAKELPTASITAVDLSGNALKVAKLNAKRHEVKGRIDFINSDWYRGIALKKIFHLVLANPPYIDRCVMNMSPGETYGSLEPEVGKYEPRLALDGGVQGLEAIRKIAGDLKAILRDGGWFFMEIGAGQADDVVALFREAACFGSIAVHNDHAGLPRVFQARKQ